jgi:hypothetical protein
MDKPTPQERRELKRRNLSYYLQVMDNNTQQVIGHLVDISPVGLMIDSKKSITTNLSFHLRMDLMENIAGKAFVEFVACSKWCRADSIQPYLFNVGFEIVKINPHDADIVRAIAEKYGTRSND